MAKRTHSPGTRVYYESENGPVVCRVLKQNKNLELELKAYSVVVGMGVIDLSGQDARIVLTPDDVRYVH